MQTQRFRNTWQLAVVVLMSWLLAGCGINNIPRYDEQVKSAWSQVENQYQRRADLIPNLVETVKGFARQEQETLTAVVEARAGDLDPGRCQYPRRSAEAATVPAGTEPADRRPQPPDGGVRALP